MQKTAGRDQCHIAPDHGHVSGDGAFMWQEKLRKDLYIFVKPLLAQLGASAPPKPLTISGYVLKLREYSLKIDLTTGKTGRLLAAIHNENAHPHDSGLTIRHRPNFNRLIAEHSLLKRLDNQPFAPSGPRLYARNHMILINSSVKQEIGKAMFSRIKNSPSHVCGHKIT